MSANQPGQPKIISIVIGVFLFTALLAFLLSLGEVVKLAGAPFLFLPVKLGLVEEVTAADVVNFNLDSHNTTLEFKSPGRYAVYTADLDLLEIANALEASGAEPWLKVQNQAGDQAVAIAFVRRGLTPFDSALARGRPVFTFIIETPGVYVLRHPARNAVATILPDAITGKEEVLTLAYILQAVLLLGLAGAIFYWARSRRLKRIRAIQQLKHIQGEAFWQKELEKHKKDRHLHH